VWPWAHASFESTWGERCEAVPAVGLEEDDRMNRLRKDSDPERLSFETIAHASRMWLDEMIHSIPPLFNREGR